MNTAYSMKRNHEGKLEVLTTSESMVDTTFKKKQAVILQRVNISISRDSLHRLETNRDKALIY